jgi:4-amino-4-deoxy-L-arabinose transferase-like glycosyltransferase
MMHLILTIHNKISRLSYNNWYWLGILSILLLATGVRYLTSFVLLEDMPFFTDANTYNLRALKFLNDFPGKDPYYWPPGTAFSLALAYYIFGTEVIVAKLLLLAISVLCVFFSVLIAEKLIGKGPGALWAGLLAAIYIPSIMLAGQPFSQHLASLCLLATAYFGLLALTTEFLIFFALTGIAFGIGCLTRSSMVSLVPIIFLFFTIKIFSSHLGQTSYSLRKLIQGSMVFFFTSVIIIFPVLLHNHSHNAGWSISTNSEKNFFNGNNPFTPHYKRGHFGQRGSENLEPEVREYLSYFINREDSRSVMMNEAIHYISEHPFITLYRVTNSIRAFWGFDHIASRHIQKFFGWGYKELFFLLFLEVGGYMITVCLVLISILCYWKNMQVPWSYWLLSLVIAYQIPYMLAFAQGTYHYPVIWLLIPFAGKTLAEINSKDARLNLCNEVKKNKWIIFGVLIFILIQIEYAYHIYKFRAPDLL